MTTELWMLVWSAVLCLVIPIVYVVGLVPLPGGLVWGLGNRDTALEVPLWVARARRAHANLVENLAPFAIVVLTAHVAGEENATTALGCDALLLGACRALSRLRGGNPVRPDARLRHRDHR